MDVQLILTMVKLCIRWRLCMIDSPKLVYIKGYSSFFEMQSQYSVVFDQSSDDT